MKYKIVIDSCGELTEAMKKDERYESVALELQVDQYLIRDDETFDQKDFLKKVKESKNSPKSSCPSPESYMNAFGTEADHIYVVTLSSQLSGSYNSAMLAKNLYAEEYPQKQVHVFDSCSASIGETLIGMKAAEYEDAGLPFEKVVEETEKYITGMQTYFVLETLETLRKNGRLSNLKAFVASALNIKPIMGSTPEGNICQLDQARGMSKALDRMVKELVERTTEPEKKILAISHCNCPERAKVLREKVEKQLKFRDIFIVDTAGVSSMYANDGGVIMVV